ncbi:hypothetical protein ABZZ74_48465 [Streptomyces sp. NPDC006476]|uniref:hypothetical protein n=1 Tax=Streptomyces sp. NPDC006476 TaxID=3157175 RepID=UPI0033B59B5B
MLFQAQPEGVGHVLVFFWMTPHCSSHPQQLTELSSGTALVRRGEVAAGGVHGLLASRDAVAGGI